jgi:hypothetical protein
MRRTLATTLVAVLCLSACAADDGLDGEGLEFRQEDHIFDDLKIYEGDTAGDESNLVWDIFEDKAYLGPMADDDLVMSFNETEIMDLDGFVVCVRERRDLVDVVTPEGEDVVVLSVMGPFIFAGDLDFADKKPGQILKMLKDQLLYTVKKDQVYEGKVRDKNVLVTATDRIRKGGTMGKLVVGALVAGECGSEGLD